MIDKQRHNGRFVLVGSSGPLVSAYNFRNPSRGTCPLRPTAIAAYLDILEGALLIQDGQRITPIDIKIGIDVGHYDTTGLRRCMADLASERGFIVTRGETVRSLGRGNRTLP